MKNRTKGPTKGTTLLEFGIIVALVSALAISVIGILGFNISSIFSDTEFAMSEKISNNGPQAPTEDPIDPFVKCSSETIIGGLVTSISPEICGTPESGDLLVAFIAHRSAVSLPAGWTGQATQQVPSYAHYLTVATKVYAEGDSLTQQFDQATSNKMLGQILLVGGDDPSVATVDTRNAGETDGYPWYLPSYTNAGDGALILGGATNYFADAVDGTMVYPSGWTLTTPETIYANRFAVAWTAAPAGNAGLTTDGTDYFRLPEGGYVFQSSAVLQITSGGTSKGPSESGYAPAPIVISEELLADEWMKLREIVYPADPTSTFITSRRIARIRTNGYTFVLPNYTSIEGNLETREDGTGFIDATAGRSSYHLSSFPPGEYSAVYTVAAGDEIWVEFEADLGKFYLFRVFRVVNSYQIGIGRQAYYKVEADFISNYFYGDPDRLRYDDGVWYLTPE